MKKIFFEIFLIFLLFGCTKNIKQSHNTSNNNNSGCISGHIITDNPTDLNGLIIYLGNVSIDKNGYKIGFLNTSQAPHYVLKSDGNFKICNIYPGKYILILYEVISGGKSYLDEKGNFIIISVENNETNNLGDIYFSW